MTLKVIPTYLINDSNKKHANDDMTLEICLTVAERAQGQDPWVEFEKTILEQ